MTIDKQPAPPKPSKPSGHRMNIASWPSVRKSEGIGISVKDGWNFGTGFGLAMAIAVPLILLLLSCVIGFVLMVAGGSLGALL